MSFFVIILRKDEPSWIIRIVAARGTTLNSITRLSLIVGMLFVMACAQAEPLSITLVNPKTNAVMKCAARESVPTPNVSLSGMVELCAKQLEAHGFVRVDERNAAQLMNK